MKPRDQFRNVLGAVGLCIVALAIFTVVAAGILSRLVDNACVGECLDRQDLAMQANMALAAWAMALCTAASLAVGAVSLFYLRANLQETRLIGEAQARAYVVVTNAGVMEHYPPGYWEVLFDFKNSGQTPAVKIRTMINVWYEISEPTGWVRIPDLVEHEKRPRSDLASQASADAIMRIYTAEMRLAQGPTKVASVRADLTVFYEDVFGRKWDTTARYRVTFTPFNQPADNGTPMLPIDLQEK